MHNIFKIFRFLKSNKKQISEEDKAILQAIDQIKVDLNSIYKSLDFATDPALIDSFIFEMNALNMRYKFYIEECRQRGLISQNALYRL
jgi:isoleucyl-tRNA synthetase